MYSIHSEKKPNTSYCNDKNIMHRHGYLIFSNRKVILFPCFTALNIIWLNLFSISSFLCKSK